MERMFAGTSFNTYISCWDVSNVINMKYMFLCCSTFNQDISNWNVSHVENMIGMFDGCTNFNQDISKWNISNVKYIDFMFSDCINLTYDLSALVAPWAKTQYNSDITGMFYEVKAKLPAWYKQY